jgi:hypothetical protein
MSSINSVGRLVVAVRNVYGNEMVYPINDTAKLFAKIAGTKTLKPETIYTAQLLGFDVEQVIEETATLNFTKGRFNG